MQIQHLKTRKKNTNFKETIEACKNEMHRNNPKQKIEAVAHLNHVDGLDDTGGKHARGTSIDERLNGRPYTGGR